MLCDVVHEQSCGRAHGIIPARCARVDNRSIRLARKAGVQILFLPHKDALSAESFFAYILRGSVTSIFAKQCWSGSSLFVAQCSILVEASVAELGCKTAVRCAARRNQPFWYRSATDLPSTSLTCQLCCAEV